MKSTLHTRTLHRLTPTLMMFAILAFEMSTDIYLPSLPEIGRFFHVSDTAVQMTLSGYLLGFSLLGCIAGPLSDSIGRRPVFLGSMAIFAGGSMICWLAPTMTGLIAARFFQGIGAGMAMVVITTIIKDLFDEKNCSRIFSSIGMVIALSPMIAPIIGGKMADLWGWKSCFLVIALVAVTLWAATMISLKESLNQEHQSRFSLGLLVQSYGQLFKRREILTFAMISALTYGGLWAWIVEAPFYMINHIGIKSVDYGYYAAIGPCAYVLGTLLNRRYVLIYGVQRLLIWGLGIMILGATAALWAAFSFPDSLIALYLTFSIYAIGLAPVFANAATKAVAVAPSQRGAASALLTTFEMSISSLCVLIVGFLSNGTPVPCMAVMFIASLLCAFMVFGITGNAPHNTEQAVLASER